MVEIFENIRKIYQFSPPCEELAEYIEFFSESSLDATRATIGDAQFSIKMFPSWTPTIWINLSSPYHLTMGNDHYFVPADKDILLVRDTIVERHNLSTDHIFSIKFFPGGLEAIFGIDQSKMTNQVVDLREILLPSLIMNARKMDSFQKRMKLLQDFFLSQFMKKKRRDHYVRFVNDIIGSYETGEMRYNVNEMAARLFTTSKTINRYFNQIIGTSPKNYFSILRARTALTEYVDRKESFTSSDFGYYDMSHFYKDVVKFTGQRLMDNRL